MTTIVKPTVGATGWDTAVDATIDAVNSMLPAGAGFVSSATTVTNSATLVDATGMSVPVAANSVYQLIAVIKITTAGGAAAGGCKGGFVGPAGVDGYWLAPSSSTSAVQVGVNTLTIVAAATTSGVSMATLTGWVTTGGTAGTCTFRFAQATATASRSVTVDVGSFMTLTKIG